MDSLEAQLSCRKCSSSWPEQVDFCPYCGTKSVLSAEKKDAAPEPIVAPLSQESKPPPFEPVKDKKVPELESEPEHEAEPEPEPEPGPVSKPPVTNPPPLETKPDSKSSWVWVVALIAVAALAGAYFFIFKKTGVEVEPTIEPPSQTIVCPGDPACPKPPKVEPPVKPPESLPPAVPPARPPYSTPAAPSPPPKVEPPKTDPANDALLGKAENLAATGNYQEAVNALNGCKGKDSRCSSNRDLYERLAEKSYECLYSGGNWDVGRRKCN